ncbi:trihelix transcription factor GTL1-like isoform X1 [Triticum dicoccoides]|uniref:trihelix transcription factor GTL1-like isoform X1 n=1 Tax=Triticum dicoccoides TaxID=85692 RepID=UPI000E7B07E2|nr:trihelix transcription factor GTL1-like isoform X1 [Triticum dicoccoides]
MQQQHQHHHQGGGSQYGAPPPADMGPFSAQPAPGPVPLSVRPPPTQQQQPQPSYEQELAAASGAGGSSFPDDDMLGDSGGHSAGGLGSGGNRWPREETLALIRIRSEMDTTFRDATLKGPLWEEVSRKLAELGYKRSAKKCKEKFENVHKYYKRTKEGRAGRQDGKSYRFFQELEALHAATAAAQHQQQEHLPLVVSAAPPPQMHAFSAPQPMSAMPPPPGPMQPAPISSAAPAPVVEPPQPLPVSLQGLSFPSMSDSESDDDDDSEDDDMTAETGGSPDGLGKRKRGGGGSKKMMAFFEGLMKQVVQRQEEMQQRFLETMEKREAERTEREEAWRRQEVARLNREQEQLAQERAAAASRDASIIAFLQRIGGQTVHVPPVVIPMPTPMQVQTPPPPKKPRQHLPPPPPSQATQQPQPQPQPQPIPAAPLQQQPPPQPPQHKETTREEAGTPRSAPAPTSAGLSLALVPVATEQHVVEAAGLGGGESGGGPSSSRWPKTEVHALIQLRMDMDNRYQENGPKGPLWEEISAGMRRLGYSRNSKRCKEKWENINKYFKKVKESNKRRPEDSKTCPYFHQLEAIYRKKHNGSGSSGAAANNAVVSVPAVAEHQNLNRHEIEIEGKKINDTDKRNNGGVGAAQVPTSNGQTTPTTATFDLGVKKPEDAVRELNEQPHREFTTDETDSDDMGDDYTDDGEDGEDDGKMQYRIQFQRPNPVGTNNAPPPPTTAATAAPTSTPASSFLAMVQ